MNGLPRLIQACLKARWQSYRTKEYRSVLIGLTDGNNITFAEYQNGWKIP